MKSPINSQDEGSPTQSKEFDKVEDWGQGQVGQHLLYMHPKWIEEQREKTACQIRSGITGPIIANCPDAETAAWLANRLNFAARIERIVSTADAWDMREAVEQALKDYKASTL